MLNNEVKYGFKKYIRSIPDYPKKGILFRDITTLINNKDAFKYTVDQFVKIASKINFDKLAAIESEDLSLLLQFHI